MIEEPRTEYNQKVTTSESVIDTVGSNAIGKLLVDIGVKILPERIEEVVDTPTEKEGGTNKKENTTLGIIIIIAIAVIVFLIIRRRK